MARFTFFSFHYKPDVHRANVVKQSWVTRDREDAGFFDSSAFERAQRTNDDALKAFLNREMDGSSVVCVLVGTQTAYRRWVRYEIQRGIWEGKGLLGVRIHGIRDLQQNLVAAGPNPFDLLGVYVHERKMYLVERNSVADGWSYSLDFNRRVLPKFYYVDQLPPNGSYPLSTFFKLYDWALGGYQSIGQWVETAAVQAKR